MEETQNLWILMCTALGKKREGVFCSAAVRSPFLAQSHGNAAGMLCLASLKCMTQLCAHKAM